MFKSSFDIKKSGYLYRCENDIIFSKDEILDKQFEKLLKISDNDNSYEITRNIIEKDDTGNICSPNAAWFLLKQTKMSSKFDTYKIHQGEIIKIGRIITRIKEIKFDKNKKNENNNNFNTININGNKSNNNSINNSKNSNNNKFTLKDIDDDILLTKKIKDLNLNPQYYVKMLDMANQRSATDSDFQEKIQILSINNNNKSKTIVNNSTKKTLSVHSKNKKKDKICRICYMEEDDEIENPIVQPCHCSGTCKYIHLNCLKQWINTKSCLKVDENECCSVFVFTESECELCKTKLPDLVEHNGKLYSLLDFTDEFQNYLVLESLTLDKENNKFLYVISLEKSGEIKMGRGQICDILLSDVSVSRVHCLLIVEGKNIYIKDNDSKFGTLILIQSPSIKLVEDLPLYIQVGRTFLSFLISKNTHFFGCCGVSEYPNFLYYHKQNEKEIETNRIFTVKTEADNDSNGENNEEEKKSEIKNEENKKSDIIEIINEVEV